MIQSRVRCDSSSKVATSAVRRQCPIVPQEYTGCDCDCFGSVTEYVGGDSTRSRAHEMAEGPRMADQRSSAQRSIARFWPPCPKSLFHGDNSHSGACGLA